MPLLVLLAVAAAGALLLGAKGGARGTSQPTGAADPGMPPEEWAAVETALAEETDPMMLDAFAMLLDQQGFTKSAALLRQKAVSIGG